jgi:hypothetical protein
MKTKPPSKKQAVAKRLKAPKNEIKTETKVIKPYFPFVPPNEPECYELDNLLQEAIQWHDAETARMKKNASAKLRFLHNLKKAGLLGNDQVIILNGETGEEVNIGVIRDALEEEEVFRAVRDLHQAGERLFEQIQFGSVRAAEALWDSTVKHVTWLQMCATQQPELLQRHARLAASFPILATLSGGWEQKAHDIVSKLDLGSGLASSRLKSGASADESHLCRMWAARAVRTLDHNRRLKRQMNCVHDFLKANPDVRLAFAPLPPWAQAAEKLPPLSSASIKAWAALTRQMIADQMPALHARPEFKTVSSDIRQHLCQKFGEGGDTEGRIRHALLDKITSAMRATLLKDTRKT